MKKLMSLLFVSTLFSAAYGNVQDIVEENMYSDYQENILISFKTKNLKDTDKTPLHTGLSELEQKLFVDALWDLTEENRIEAFAVLDEIQPFHYDLVQKLRINILRMKYRGLSTIPEGLKTEITNALIIPTPDIKLVYTIASYETLLVNKGQKDLVELAKKHKNYKQIEKASAKELADDTFSDIFFRSPENSSYGSGDYKDTLKLFLFCRQDRNFPCLMVMKDKNGVVVRNEDHSIWTHKALAMSESGDPSHIRNGNTPAGVMTIDGVMPTANLPLSYGKNRRLILNFIPKSENEANIKTLLPESSHKESWWNAGAVARDVGRNLFRIHGTGKINTDLQSTFYPFRKTNGCIAQRENTYDGVEYKDQRLLLDAMMEALDLEPIYENELNIKGILYIVELDNQAAAVEAKDLKLKGIE